ncbi:acyltransferase family protein [Pseudoxanthomonas dokdonensis]|uniref:Membrane protein n=1 Tax=Pseudoxanthomonas dokdonensis TaxID=344882 RepID=A0A0R0CD38_9GAMM|nr:heparan-alpha-glucosaminide N-acetyltransferase domain-containing protein [Pseudoxanthomonas dokdonensis]KRG67625.1 membrane protein [Pseudoxanthomonas dokdonensis]
MSAANADIGKLTRPPRFASVDALRGITVAAMLLVNNPGDWDHVYAPLLHSQWNGCTPTDLVFPFFLFIVGVSIALGITPRVEAGADRSALAGAVCWRAAKIILIGLTLHALAYWWLDREWFRPWGVLQRIGICFAVAGLLTIHVPRRWQWLLTAVLLIGYWALLAGNGGYLPWTNLASRLDTTLLGPLLYQYDPATGLGHDPEGLLSTLPAIASVLLGMRAGDWLRAGRTRALWLFAGALLLAGVAATPVMPFNKNLWTSSYALWTAGWACVALAAAHVLIDVRGWPALGRRFGVNAIAAYAGSSLMVIALAALGWWQPIYQNLFVQPMAAADPRLPSLCMALVFVAVWWLLVWWMDARRWYLKV